MNGTMAEVYEHGQLAWRVREPEKDMKGGPFGSLCNLHKKEQGLDTSDQSISDSTPSPVGVRSSYCTGDLNHSNCCIIALK